MSFSSFARCKVISVEEDSEVEKKACKTVHVSVLSPHESTSKLHLYQPWDRLNIQVDDILNVCGPSAKNKFPTELKFSFRSQDILIVHPHVFVTATAVSTSHSCIRRPVLEARFRSSGPPPEPVLVGNILHQVFQTCIIKNTWDTAYIRKIVQEHVRQTLDYWWYLDIDMPTAIGRLMDKSNVLTNFAKNYLLNKHPEIRINKANNVEEDIASSQFGLKGKIDVSIEATLTSKRGPALDCIAPFEFKSGKKNTTNERIYRAQTMLYTLLMSERYDVDVNAGILYYSSEDKIIQVHAHAREIQDLILLRNDIASYLNSVHSSASDEQESVTQLGQAPSVRQKLPDPVDNRSCNHCYASEICTLYRKTIERDDIGPIDNQELSDNYQARTSDITKEQSNFFTLWEDLITLEEETTGGGGRLRDSLANLFMSDGDLQRRELIVDLKPPEFDEAGSSKLIRSFPGSKAESLNHIQREAISKALSAKDYSLILGMPGTGKTHTTAELIRQIIARGQSVLLTSYQHSAVDNLLLRLRDLDTSMIRIGDPSKVNPQLHDITLKKETLPETLDAMDDLFLRSKLVATTCLSLNEPLFYKRTFDYCIVDEASQITLPTCIAPLRFADTFVLVGDHNQLPPLVKSMRAKAKGLDISLFKRLSDAHPSSISYLTNQYRMAKDIMELCNRLVYNNRLVCGTEEVANRKLNYKHDKETNRKEDQNKKKWLQQILVPDKRVVFVDTDKVNAKETAGEEGVHNEGESNLITQLTGKLLEYGIPQQDVGVISPYRNQIQNLKDKLQSKYPEIEIMTADKSQGRDKECIIMSFTRSNQEANAGQLLSDWRRINVCLTRAKSKLIMFGSKSTLVSSSFFAKLVNVLEEHEWIYTLPDEAQVDMDVFEQNFNNEVVIEEATEKEQTMPEPEPEKQLESIQKVSPTPPPPQPPKTPLRSIPRNTKQSHTSSGKKLYQSTLKLQKRNLTYDNHSKSQDKNAPPLKKPNTNNKKSSYGLDNDPMLRDIVNR